NPHTTDSYTLSLHDALPILDDRAVALEREPGGNADHQLLADPDVEDVRVLREGGCADRGENDCDALVAVECFSRELVEARAHAQDRKSTRLNSSHLVISYAV